MNYETAGEDPLSISVLLWKVLRVSRINDTAPLHLDPLCERYNYRAEESAHDDSQE
jgi:hypothetical protein